MDPEQQEELVNADFPFAEYVARQVTWGLKTFGPGPRTKGIIEHIKKELKEIEKDPHDLKEWIDIIILGADGAWRAIPLSVREAMTPEAIGHLVAYILWSKLVENENRQWPDWRQFTEDQAIEHVREPQAPGMFQTVLDIGSRPIELNLDGDPLFAQAKDELPENQPAEKTLIDLLVDAAEATCPRCHGTGIWPPIEAESDGADEDNYKPPTCARCNGSGEVLTRSGYALKSFLARHAPVQPVKEVGRP